MAELHQIENIVTPGMYNAARRMRVPGGWLYWVEAASGTLASAFVPDPVADLPPTAAAA